MDADNVPLSCADAQEGGYMRAVVAGYLMKDIGATATCCGTAAEWRAVWISYSVGGQEGNVEYGQKSGGWEVWPDAHACTALSRYQT